MVMRKFSFFFVLIAFCFLLAFPSAAHAAIMKASDPESGLVTLYSSINLQNEPWEKIGMWKPLKKNYPYYLELVTNGYKDWIFFNGQVSIRIKGTWYDFATVEQQTTNDWPNVRTTGQYIFPQSAIDQLAQLRGAETAELRLSFQDKTYVQWTVPDTVLTEWQEVLMRTK